MALVVSEWIERYKEDQQAATLELINYVIKVSQCTIYTIFKAYIYVLSQTSGVNTQIAVETFEEGDVDEVLKTLEKEKEQEEADYPAVSKKKGILI